MLRSAINSNHTLLALLLPFLVVAAGGSGLHHAPIFGMHGCCPGHKQGVQQTDQRCPCGHHKNAPDSSFSDLSSKQPGAGNKSEPCSICQFFATTHASSSVAIAITRESVSYLNAGTLFASVDVQFPAGFFARGPPRV